MSKLVLMQGLVASGKSTRAKELLAEYGNACRLNRDLLRTMLHCDATWSGKQERITKDVARALAKHLLTDGKVGVLIIDDTNLHPGTVESWRFLAQEYDAKFEIVRMDTPIDECLRRDALREKPVGRHVILGMAMQYGLSPLPNKGYVLCDIDGTLADIRHRLHYVKQEPKDWDGFFGAMGMDRLRLDVTRQVEVLRRDGYDVVLVSGRPDNYRTVTEDWLRLYGFPDTRFPLLFMRRAGDHRPDTVVKEEILRTYFSDRSLIHTIFDDRRRLLEMWAREVPHAIIVNVGGEDNDF